MHLWGSGAILNEALRAQQILAETYQIAADVWSVTSYNELRRDVLEVDRWNRLHPNEEERSPYVAELFQGDNCPIVAASDYMKALSDQLSPCLPGRITSLGTDGFGRSDNREYLRRFFEVNGESIAAAALSRLARQGKFDRDHARRALSELNVDPEAPNPVSL